MRLHQVINNPEKPVHLEEKADLVTECVTKLFVEQPLASPGSAKNNKHFILYKFFMMFGTKNPLIQNLVLKSVRSYIK